ncbi:MAG: hypothetical protein WC462_02660 [archaeon]
MTFNNSVLLVVKQSPGIAYNDLFARVSARYKNPASARSALSRSLKDLVSFGLLKNENSKFFVTDKGFASMNIEMKDKLVLRLNEEMKRPMNNLEQIVRFLVILYQRGIQDKDLLNNAKENASFTIHDVEELRTKIRAQRKYLKKMSELIQQQAEKLRELDFNDSIEFVFDDFFASKVTAFSNSKKIIVETKDNDVLSKIPDHWKKQSVISVEGESIPLMIQLLISVPSAKAILYLPGIKVTIMAGKANCFGSYKILKSFSEIKLSEALNQKQKPVETQVQGISQQSKPV